MPTTNTWEEFFDGHAPVYMDNAFTRDTVNEVAFVLDMMNLSPGARSLDVGCGTGRHSIELAIRGYSVTGVDLSAGMLAQAKAAAKHAGVTVAWIKCGATRFRSAEPFDGAICLCEGAFALLGQDDDPHEHDLAIPRRRTRGLGVEKLRLEELRGLEPLTPACKVFPLMRARLPTVLV